MLAVIVGPLKLKANNGPGRRGGRTPRPLAHFSESNGPRTALQYNFRNAIFSSRCSESRTTGYACEKPEKGGATEPGLGRFKGPSRSAPVLKAFTPFFIFLASLLTLEVVKGFLLAPQAWAAVAAQAPPEATGVMAFAMKGLSVILHLDKYLGEVIVRYGTATYAILFGIVFAETGLVVTPFLPGDSLLFATGALAALGKLDIRLLLAVYVSAAILGDAVNYAIGNYFGAKALKSRLIKKEYIDKTEEFYKKYGGKTVVLARFIPIVRTFAPFIAGVGSMAYGKFGMYNVLGAMLWTAVCTGAGYAFGNVPAVHSNFSLVVLGIIVVSVLPVAYELSVSKAEK